MRLNQRKIQQGLIKDKQCGNKSLTYNNSLKLGTLNTTSSCLTLKPDAITLLIFSLSVMLTGLVLNNGNVNATASTLSLSISSNTVSVDTAPVGINGTFVKSNPVTITAFTDNATGYELRIKSSSGSDASSLINTSDNTVKLSSISTATTEAQFSALTGTSYNGKWGYLPSKYNSSTNTDFLPAPTTTGDIINKTECANGVSPCPAEDNYTLAIGARVDSSIKLGTYNNTFVILATANAIPYSITYDDNVVSNMPTDVSSSSVSTTVPIASNVPVRDGYTFLGWCTVVPTNNNGTDVCTGGTQYAAGANWTIDQTGANNLHLYAMWQKEKTLQEITSSDCTTTAKNAKDARDGEEYKIQRLADGKCWMLDNLRLDPTSVSLSTLQGNTNASNATLSYLKNGGGSGKYPASGVSNAWTSSSQNSYNLPYINAASKDTTVTSYGAGSGKVGVYYNYCAASAGSYCYASGSGTGNATEDLCPAGWRMPTGGDNDSSNEYYNLGTALGLTFDEDEWAFTGTTYQTALSAPLSGYFFNGSAFSQGDYGYFWSSTINLGYGMYDLYVGSDGASPTGTDSRYFGNSMRCILDD